MTLLHPGILIAGLGLALAPLIIHLIHRRQMPREPWAAMEWLRAAHDTTSRRIRIEHWLLMGARMLMLVLLGATVARPLVGSDVWPSGWGTARVNRVIVIDDSLSMQAAGNDGHSLFEEARRAALSLVEGSGPGDGLAVVTASTLGRKWMSRPVHDRRAVRSLIEELSCLFAMNDFPTALRRASEVLDEADAPSRREVYFITDVARDALPDELELEGVDRLSLVKVGGSGPPNVALTEFRCVSQIVGQQIAARFMVEASNYGAESVDKRNVDILLNGQRVTSMRVGPIAPGGRASGESEIALPRRGSNRLTAWIRHEDALPIDDIRHLVVYMPDNVKVLLVDSHSSGPKTTQDLFYLSTAVLRSDTSDEAGLLEGRMIDPSDIDQTLLDNYALIILGNVSRLPRETWNRLGTFVRRGGGLMVFLGEGLRAEEYNQLLQNVTSKESLTAFKLKERIVFAMDADPPRLVLADLAHPVTADLAVHDKGGLSTASVQGYWETDGPAATESVRTLLRLSNGRPALTVHRCGHGRVATWFMGPTMSDTNLPAKPDYLPLMMGLTSYLSSGVDALSQSRVGEPLVTSPSNAVWEHVSVIRPDGSSDTVEVSVKNGQAIVAYQDTMQPGFYQLRRDGWRRDFAVNVGTDDSDLRSEDSRTILTRLGPKVTLVDPRQRSLARALRPPVDLATVSGFMLLLLIGMETLLAGRFGRRG